MSDENQNARNYDPVPRDSDRRAAGARTSRKMAPVRMRGFVEQPERGDRGRGPEATHDSTIFIDVRYTLPGSMPAF
jgi:hypothetical protein